MTLEYTEYSWYNFDRILSYDAYFNFIVGSRGEGKTFGAIKRAIERFIKHREEFIYVRRTETALDVARPVFFDAIIAKNIFPDWDFRIKEDRGEMSPKAMAGDENRVWKRVVTFIPLTGAQKYKSANFPLVTTMIYDEFIEEEGYGKYVKNEYSNFLGLYETVDRRQSKTRVFFLANAVTIMNPYFTALDINPDLLPEYSTHGVKLKNGKRFVVLHISDNKAFKEEIGETAFAQFVAGTEYGEYANNNGFKDSHQELLKKRPGEASYRYSLETAKGLFSVWQDFETGLFFIESKQPKLPHIFTLVSANMSDTKRLVTVNHRLIGSLRTAYAHGRTYFDKASTRNVFSEVFKR